jgi:hypothetical protein
MVMYSDDDDDEWQCWSLKGDKYYLKWPTLLLKLLMKNLKERKNIFKCPVVCEDEYILRDAGLVLLWYWHYYAIVYGDGGKYLISFSLSLVNVEIAVKIMPHGQKTLRSGWWQLKRGDPSLCHIWASIGTFEIRMYSYWLHSLQKFRLLWNDLLGRNLWICWL